jgi:formamidase
VELVDIEADPWEQWGYTIQVPGFGFLRDEFPDPFIVHWRLHGNEYAESDQLPGVRIRCNPHPGVLGLAPSADLRQRVTEREAEVAEREGFALPPEPAGAVPEDASPAQEGLRTVPPRETAGKHRHKADIAGRHRPAAGVRRGRSRLDRRRPLRSG